MDALIENAPRIISEAAKSPLGLAALVVLAVSVLSYAFFRRTAEHVRLLVFMPTFAGLILLVIALADVDRFRPSPPLRGDDRDDGSVRTPQSAFSLADAPEVAEDVITQMLHGEADGLSVPFCDNETVYRSADALRTTVSNISRSRRVGPIAVSTAGAALVSDVEQSLYEHFAGAHPCAQANVVSPDDFVVEVHVHFMNSNEEGRWILILDRISGLGKAVF